MQTVYVPTDDIGDKDAHFYSYGDVWLKPTEAVLLSKEDANRVKELLNTIYQNIRSAIPTHIDFDSVNDVALYHSFHKVEQALNILNKAK